MLQETILQQLEAQMPRLARFSAVLAGDPHRFDLFTLGFLAHFENWLQVNGSEKAELEADFAARIFSSVYDFWLLQIEQGRVKPVILKYDDSMIQPGLFGDGKDGMERQTGAFLVGLSPQQRAALLLVVGEGFSYRQTAHILKVDEAVVSRHVALAKAALAGHRYPAPKGLLKNKNDREHTLDDAQTRLMGT